MRPFPNFVSPVVAIGIGAFLVAGTGMADAATGGNFLLGKSNSATTTTTLSNTRGTPLALKAPTGKPPLAVNNTVRVPRLNADLLDGLHATALQRRISGTCATGAVTAITTAGAVACRSFQAPFAHVVVVHSGATPIASGASLTSAYATAAAAATATSPWLVLVEPGTYDLNGGMLSLHSSVQLSGVGEDVTTITSTGDVGGVLTGADGSVVTDLSVVAISASDGHSVGYALASGSAVMRRVAVTTNGAFGGGANIGIYVNGGSLVADDVHIRSSNSTWDDLALYVSTGSALVTNSTLSGTDGGTTFGSASVRNFDTAHIVGTQLDGTVDNNGTMTCVGAYDGSFAAIGC